MKVLLDHCVPKRLSAALSVYEVATAADNGWERLKNGLLLQAAALAGYAAMVTSDRQLRFQQDPKSLPLAVVVMIARTNKLQDLLPLVPQVLDALSALTRPVIIEVGGEEF